MNHGGAQLLTRDHLEGARHAIQPHVWHTPLVPSVSLNRRTGADVHLKLECWQRTGSFKVRGALCKLASLTPDERVRGIVTASAGNHALGVAYAAQVLGSAPLTVFVPESAAGAKVERLAAFECDVQQAGADYDAAHALAEAYAREHSALYLSAYDDPLVIAGQGTVGLEIMEDLPNAELLLVPVGGGGLIAGIAVAAKAINPSIRIVGLQPEASPSAYLSLRDGRPYETYSAASTICDGLAGGFGRVPFELAAHLLDDVIVVPEAEVRNAVYWLVAHEQVLVEGSAAIAVAPLLRGRLSASDRQVVAVLTGRNIDAAVLKGILAEVRNP